MKIGTFKTEAALRFQEFSGATILLVVAAVIGRLITLLFQTVIAHEFGVGIVSDAYFVVEIIPEFFLTLGSIGISSVFIPMYAEVRMSRGEIGTREFACSFFLLSEILCLCVVGITIVFSSQLIVVMAPGFPENGAEIASNLLRIMAVGVLFVGPGAVCRGILHSHNNFFVPEFSRLAYNLLLLGSAWIFLKPFGVYILGWGIVISAFIMFLIQFFGVFRFCGFRPCLTYDRRILKKAVNRIFMFIIAGACIDGIFVLNRMVASGLEEGSIAILNYAARIVLLPVGLFALPLRTALFPALSEMAVTQQFKRVADTTLSGLKILLFFVMPTTLALAVLSLPLTTLIFERGAFEHSATLATSRAIIFYAAGIPAIATYFFFQNVFLCLGDVFIVILINIAAWSMNLCLNLIFSRYWGYQGIAFGTSLAMNLTVILMMFWLKRHKLKQFDIKAFMISLGKVVFASAIMGCFLILIPEKLNRVLIPLMLNYAIINIFILIFLGALIYLISAWILQFEEMDVIVDWVRRLKGIIRVRKK